MDLMTTTSTPPLGSAISRSQSGHADRWSRGRPTRLLLAPEPPGEQKTIAESPASQQKPMKEQMELTRKLRELTPGVDQRSVKQLNNFVFPKMAVLKPVDPSAAPCLLEMLNASEDKLVIRYAFYFLGSILAEHGTARRNWDAMPNIDGQGGEPPRETLTPILNSLILEASSNDPNAQGRKAAALKAFLCAPHSNPDAQRKLYSIVESMFDKTTEGVKLKRKKGIFTRQSADKEVFLRNHLQYLALSTIRRMPDQGMDEEMVRRVIQGIGCSDPVGARHALAKLVALANKNVLLVANALTGAAGLAQEGSLGLLIEAMLVPDMFARTYLARVLSIMVHAPKIAERGALWEQFSHLLYQMVYDESEKVALEVISGIVGSAGGEGSMERRSAGWDLLCSAEFMVPETTVSKEGPGKGNVPAGKMLKRIVFKVVCNRLDFILCSSSRLMLHAAARVVGEIGKARAAATLISEMRKARNEDEKFEDGTDGPSSVLDGPTSSSPTIGGGLEALAPPLADMESASDIPNEKAPKKKFSPKEPPTPVITRQEITTCLTKLSEAVRTVVACECPYVRASAIKAMIWMQSADESADELKETIAGELTDPSWPASLLNDLLLTLHLRFKATPSMAAMLLDVAGLWVTLVPAKVEMDVLQSLWKTCLMGCGPEGKQAALEAVGAIVDLRNASGSFRNGALEGNEPADPKSAVALQRLIQAAVWFLGENANYAAGEYAWEPPASAALGLLRMMEGTAMLSAAAGRNVTLALSISRLQRTVFCGSWEVRIIALQALMTIALRSGEPYRFQIYEFFHTLCFGSKKDKLSAADVSNGEDRGATGTGLTTVVLPMMRLLDDMYQAQDQLLKDLRDRENAKQPWSDDELEKLYQTHERLLDLVSIFCFIPRNSYLPLGPWSFPLVNMYRSVHAISSEAAQDPAVLAGISDLLLIGGGSEFVPAGPAKASGTGVAGLEDLLWAGTPPGMDLVNDFLGGPSVLDAMGSTATVDGGATQTREGDAVLTGIESMWESSLLDGSDDDRKYNDGRSSASSSPESTRSGGSDRRSNLSGFPHITSRLSMMSPPRQEEGGEEEEDFFDIKKARSPIRPREVRFREPSSPGSPGSAVETAQKDHPLPVVATVGPLQELSAPLESDGRDQTPTPGGFTSAETARSLPTSTTLPVEATSPLTSPIASLQLPVGSFLSLLSKGRSSSSLSTDSAVIDGTENAAAGATPAEAPSAAAAADAAVVDGNSKNHSVGDDDNRGAATNDDMKPWSSAEMEKPSQQSVKQFMGDLLDWDESTAGQAFQMGSSDASEPKKTPDLLGDMFSDFPSMPPSAASTSGITPDNSETGQDATSLKDDKLQFDFLGLSAEPTPGSSTPVVGSAGSRQTDFLSDLLASGLGSMDVRETPTETTGDERAALQEAVESKTYSAEPSKLSDSKLRLGSGASSPLPMPMPSPEPTSIEKEGKGGKHGRKSKSKDSVKESKGKDWGKGFMGLFDTSGGGKSSSQSKSVAGSSSSADSESSGGSKKRGEAVYDFTPDNDATEDWKASMNSRGSLPLGTEAGIEGMGQGRGGDSPYIPSDVAANAGGPPVSSRKPPTQGLFRNDSGPGSAEGLGPAQSTESEQSEEGAEGGELAKEGKKHKEKKKGKSTKKKDKGDKHNEDNCVLS